MQVVSLLAARGGGADRSERGVGLTPVLALQAALILLIVGNLGRIPVLDLGFRSAPILINDLSIAAFLAVGAAVMARARTLRLNDVALAGILFACIGAISAVAAVPRFGLSGLELVGSLAYLARWAFYFALYIVIINCVRARDTEAVWSALEGAMMVIAAFGLVQAFFLPDFAFIVYPEARALYDWDPQRHRLVSTVLDPNILSAMIVTVLLVQLARLASGAQVALWKPTLLFAALVMTLSRSGMLAFFVGCLLLLVVRGMSRRVMRFAGLMLLLVLAALPRLIEFANQYARFGLSDASSMARVITWQRAFATFVDHPWFGIGFNTYGFVQERRGIERLGASSYSADGGLLFIAVMTGVVGLLIYLTMLWLVVRRSRAGWRDARATAGERGLLIGAAAATVAVCVHSIFANSLLTPFVMEPLLVLWGLTFVIVSDLRHRQAAPLAR